MTSSFLMLVISLISLGGGWGGGRGLGGCEEGGVVPPEPPHPPLGPALKRPPPPKSPFLCPGETLRVRGGGGVSGRRGGA